MLGLQVTSTNRLSAHHLHITFNKYQSWSWPVRRNMMCAILTQGVSSCLGHIKCRVAWARQTRGLAFWSRSASIWLVLRHSIVEIQKKTANEGRSVVTCLQCPLKTAVLLLECFTNWYMGTSLVISPDVPCFIVYIWNILVCKIQQNYKESIKGLTSAKKLR